MNSVSPRMIRSSSIGVLVLATACCALSSGCSPPTLKNPLINPEAALPVPGLNGSFRKSDKDGSVTYLHIGPAGEEFPVGYHRVIYVIQEPANSEMHSVTLLVFGHPIGDDFLIHIPFNSKRQLKDQHLLWKSVSEWEHVEYLVVRVSINDDNLEMSYLNEDFVEQQIQNEKLSGEVTGEAKDATDSSEGEQPKKVLISAESDELIQFFGKHMDQGLFEETSETFERLEQPKTAPDF